MKKTHLNAKHLIFLCFILIISSISMEYQKLFGQDCVDETFTSLSGTITDGSGTNDYNNNQYCQKLIDVSSGYTITLTFSEFSTESSYDFVKIYNGSTTSSPLLAEYDGENWIPPPVSSSANEMLILFTSDGSVTEAGWTASYTTQGGPPPPPTSLWDQNGDHIFNTNNGNVGIGTTSPTYKLQITDNGRMGICLGGPSTSGGAVGDILFLPSNGGSINGARYWDWSFRTDSWSSYPGDFVLYSHNGSSYTSPIIFQADGDVVLGAGNGAARKGNIGIGTTTPDAKLNIISSGSIGSGSPIWQNAGLLIDQNGTYKLGLDGNQISGSHDLFVCAEGSRVVFNTQGTAKMVITEDKVGVGMGAQPDPAWWGSALFAVNGEIMCEKVRVVNDVPSADYVFDPGYRLRGISEVETFVKSNRHLPDIPSAAEFKENGYSLGEMDNLLLKKIEEQMLYIIELNKKIEQLEGIIKEFNN